MKKLEQFWKWQRHKNLKRETENLLSAVREHDQITTQLDVLEEARFFIQPKHFTKNWNIRNSQNFEKTTRKRKWKKKIKEKSKIKQKSVKSRMP